MLRPIATCAALAVIAAMPALGQTQDVSRDTVVARVGEVEITLGHVILLRQQLPQQYAQLPDDVLFEGIIDQLVDQQLLSTQTQDVPRTVELKLENERRALMANQTILSLMEPPVSDGELEAAYQAQFVDVEPAKEYNASHILVETEEAAQAIVEELNGGADFAEVAKEKSTGPSGPQGGALGWFGAGRMVPEFETAVTGMEVETISAPVQTQFGWHVIRLNEVRDVEPPAFDQVRGQLEQEIRQARISDQVAELRETGSVEMLTEGLTPDLIRNDTLLDTE